MKIEQATVDFLNDLRVNNYREWFHSQKPRYETAKKNILEVTSELMAGINEFDPALGFSDPRKSLFRIARDTRFSPNKQPYKTHFGVCLSPIGVVRYEGLSSYYIHIDPTYFFVSCGVYMAAAPQLKLVREAIEQNWNEFQDIIQNKVFKKEFGDLSRDDKVLKRVPVGFGKDSPAAEYLKLTNFYVYKNLPPELLTDEKMVPEILRLFRLMEPLQTFLNRAVTNK